MIPRFNLYGDPIQWVENIREEPDGAWVTWKSVAAYVNYCQQEGLNFDPIQPDEPLTETNLDLTCFDDDEDDDEFLELDELDEDEGEDTFDYMSRH